VAKNKFQFIFVSHDKHNNKQLQTVIKIYRVFIIIIEVHVFLKQFIEISSKLLQKMYLCLLFSLDEYKSLNKSK